jgi:membrane dipeptidase
MFIVDAHLDLAYNALRHGRQLRRPVTEARQAERRSAGGKNRGTLIVTLPELPKAGVGLVFGTIYVSPANNRFSAGSSGGDSHMVYHNADEAHKLGQEQLDYYHRLADEVDYVRLVGDLQALENVVASHSGQLEDTEESEPLLGIVPLMEGADPIREPAEAEMWYERGLRLIGLSWDDTRYSPGAWGAGGKLTRDGHRLLEVMADFGFILDLTHMAEEATLQALDRYEGSAIATHSNARALVPTNRQLSDTQIRRIAERDGVIGIVFANAFLKAGHRRGHPKEAVTLDHVVAHIDHMCQLIGDAAHIGLGSDFDGGFGVEDIPAELHEVGDLALIGKALGARGYSDADVAGIMGDNWLNLLRRSWQ